MKTSIPDCPVAPDELSVEQAQTLIQQELARHPLPASSHQLPLSAALGRVLSQPILSPIDVPAQNNAAMDGYAFPGALLTNPQSHSNTLTLPVCGQALAGLPYAGPLVNNACIRIMTGAQMPNGCDTVIPQEWVRSLDNAITFSLNRVRPGDHCRLRGEDLTSGQPALPMGRWLRPADLGLLASLGIASVPVRPSLRAAIFSTGSELRTIGVPLLNGGIYDSNRYTLMGMLQRLGIEVLDLGIVPDDPDQITHTLEQAAKAADIVLTSGGISVGDADFTRQQLGRHGKIAFWNLAIRPGRPMAFGRLHPVCSTPSASPPPLFFGLPGNPVAVMVAFYQFVRPALLQLMGAGTPPPLLLPIQSAVAIRKKMGRTEYQRGFVFQDASGIWQVRPTAQQGSGVLRSMSEANCFIVLSHDQGPVQAGERVHVQLFEGLV